ncbi:MAG: DUF2272 domain-containing protein, partial [Gemmatimonadetes bacterium]|nr:DUF2272 domain-containing protein [Gemmatimonadota bacterium]
VFRAQRIEEAAPALGDVIQNNRGGQNITYDFAEKHSAYLSHSAIVVDFDEADGTRFAVTVGGNESDSIRRKRIPLHADGKIVQRQVNPFICVIKNGK